MADPEARVLVVNVELCTLHFQKKSDTDTLVANAIFADGVSAALVSGRKEDSAGPRFRLDSFLSTHIPDSEDDMAWTIGQAGFDMRLSVYVPRIIKQNIRHVVDALLARAGRTSDDVDIWAYHPGGRAILDRVAKELGLSQEAFTESYEVLRDYGNMSSATILFVLKRLLESGKRGTVFAAAFGPGLTVESAVMELVE
jgi:predicted naringenin-chalcone synthase